jgi:hypothetical protein
MGCDLPVGTIATRASKLPSLLLVFWMTFRELKKPAQTPTGFFRPAADVLHKSLRPDFNQRLLE